MTMGRSNYYGRGTPAGKVAPLPFATQDTLGPTYYNYNFGVLGYQEVDGQVLFYSGNGKWISLGGGASQIKTINTIQPNSNGNFTINGTANQIAVTPGTNSLSLSLTGGTNAQMLIGGNPPAYGNEVHGNVQFDGIVGGQQFNISNTSQGSIPCILYGEIPVSGDGTYTLATATGVTMSGTYYIQWSFTNRIQTVSLFCDTTRFDDTISTLQVLSNNSYLQQDVFSNFQIVSQNSDLSHFLQVTLGNRNGGTSPITVLWVGNPSAAPRLNPGIPTTSTPLTLYGFYQTTNGNMAYNGGNLSCTQFSATGDAGGSASTISLSNVNSTTISTGTGTVKMSSTNNANNTAWLKIYIGTTAYWIPAWTTNSP